MSRHRCHRALATAALLACMAATALAQPAAAEPLASTAPTRSSAVIGRAVAVLVVRERPATGAVLARIDPADDPPSLLTLGERVVSGQRFVKVLISRRGRSTGWVVADHLELSATPWRVEVSVARRLLTLRRSGRVVFRSRVVVGAPATPTPTGLFAVHRRIAGGTSNPLGPSIVHLTALSGVLYDFGGGSGRVAIHGMRGSLVAPLGSAVSHGCIRMPNRAVRLLAARARPGTPVIIRAR